MSGISGASLRLRINLLITGLLLAFILVLLALQLAGTRKSVQEEITAGSEVAGRLLGSMLAPGWMIRAQTLQAFLQQMGRLRATELSLRDGSGRELYHSPPSAYKAGRDAPDWYARLVSPPAVQRRFTLQDGELLMQDNPSRAVLDGWDDMLRLLALGLAALLLAQALVYWRVGRLTQPLRQIAQGLQDMTQGAYHTRLPALPGAEAAAIGSAFNRMAQAIEDNLQARAQAAEAEARLQQSREIAQLVERRLEDERRQIARELHDETSQSVTAIHSLALLLAQRGGDAHSRQIAQTIVEAAGQLHRAVQQMIPRLRPPALDNLGLGDAVQNQIDDWRLQHPQRQFELRLPPLPAELDADVSLAAFRVMQEACANALRHGRAQRLSFTLGLDGDGLQLCVEDDGVGLPPDWPQARGFGIRGMQERAQMLRGELQLSARTPRGTRVELRLPLPGAAA
ncbi:two-component system, NarL family, sensor histidine kinase UhpB [Solimonas aquatica]|uniref:histidine kinase n=1 Tax=Solimonas aquatica TaxID=489703 RepID=A0A1H9GNC6_9GAMM|nr:ATP-binding protein [Solimonas aquatica]SEQ51595.1 two-component system, NarL family, sensor histidine kinase UhpB [Solimonas aquatica]